jgi:hypothetical protein
MVRASVTPTSLEKHVRTNYVKIIVMETEFATMVSVYAIKVGHPMTAQ